MMPPEDAEPIEPAGSMDEDPMGLSTLYDPDGDSLVDSFTSMWSHERNVYWHGRRYHANEKGTQDLVPNDETQQDQLDLFHAIYTAAASIHIPDGLPMRLHLAPIPARPDRVLDVGTGTGIWAVEFADEHPDTEVIGFDVTDIQPTWVPPNVKFRKESVDDEWNYTPDSFDLVHLRGMQAAISNWQHVLKQAYKILKPGGAIEIFSEVPRVFSDDNTIPEGWPLVRWLSSLEEALEKIGRRIIIEEYIDRDLMEAGFTNFRMEWFKVPWGPWPKDPKMKRLGAMQLVHLLQGIEGWTLTVFMQILGMSLEDTRAVIEEVKRTVRNRRVHSYMTLFCIYAQKPRHAV